MSNELFRILIVDDNANNLFTLKALLSRLHECEIIEAASGEAALMATLEYEIQLILLDVQMPGMDGFETARHLKMTERTREIPIIFLTAVFKAESFVARGYAIGAVDYLTKPIDENQLLNRIRLYHSLFQRRRHLETALARLEQSEARYRGYFESNLIGMAGADADCRWSDVNARLCEILGRSRSQLLGHDWREFTHADDRNDEQAQLHRVLRGETDGYTLEQRCVHQNGSTVHVSVAVRAIRGTGERLDHFVLLLQDISERVRARDELIQARHAAESANRAKSAFLAAMSHELRTPLNAVLGFSELMQSSTECSSGQQEQLSIINRSGQHLLTLINDILDMSKIEAGRMQLDSVPLDLGELIRDVLDMMRVRAEQKGLRLTLDQSSSFPRFIRGDAPKLRQVLINLLSNAVKFTQQGHIQLRLSADAVTAGHKRLHWEVEDSGEGIPLEQQQAIFLPFVQLGTNNEQVGTGLGLALTRSFVELMGGELSVESSPGEGSRFHFTLPIEMVDGEEVARISAATTPLDVLGLVPGQAEYRLLIVEDQLENRLLLKALLQRVGLSAAEAVNGAEAVAQFQQLHPQLIWMDCVMPGMDGLEATRRIRALPGGAAVKIVALSAGAFMEERDKMLAAGMDDYISKPFRAHEIFDSLQRLLGVEFRYAEAAASPAAAASITAARLGALPAPLRQSLHQALISLDMERCTELVEQVAAQDAALGAELLQQVGQYQFEPIIARLEELSEAL